MNIQNEKQVFSLLNRRTDRIDELKVIDNILELDSNIIDITICSNNLSYVKELETTINRLDGLKILVCLKELLTDEIKKIEKELEEL